LKELAKVLERTVELLTKVYEFRTSTPPRNKIKWHYTNVISHKQ